MAFVPIDVNKIKVGDPITADLLQTIKSNFDDHEFKISSLSITGGSVYILNGDFSFINFNSDPTGQGTSIWHYKARTDFSINDFRIQLFDRSGYVNGELSFELEKASNTNPSNFTTILNSPLTFNFFSDGDYTEKVASIDGTKNDITTGQVLRLRVVSRPGSFYSSVLIAISGE
jgi:hypothetical protein